jgi:hypothetical protein
MSIRKLIAAFALATCISASNSSFAVEIYTCKVNAASTAVGGLKSGALSLASDVHPPHPMGPSVRIGACKAANDWTIAIEQKISSAVIAARNGNVTEAWVAATVGPIRCICVTEPCPCAGKNANITALAKAAAPSPATTNPPQETAKLCPGHPSCGPAPYVAPQ